MKTEPTGAGVSRPSEGAEVKPAMRADQVEAARLQRNWRIKVSIVWIAIFAVIALGMSFVDYDVQWMKDNASFILKGIWVTILMTIISMFGALIFALLGALGRLSRNSISYGVSGFYTSFFRGTPLIVQIFLIYNALPQIAAADVVPTGIRQYFVLSPVLAGIIALALNYGAYITEIFRAGIQSITHGQSEAAEALGMTYSQRMRRIVLPQAARVVIPPIGNEFIAMIKDTALVSFTASAVFWYEIFKRSQVVATADFRYLEAFTLVAGMYWALTIIFTFFQSRLERKMSAGYVRGATGGQTLGGQGH